MNRSFGYFLIFCALLIGLAGIAYWWAGPTLTRMLLDQEFRAEPVWVLHFANPVELTAQAEYERIFVAPGRELITEGRGQVVRVGHMERQIVGSVGDQWQRMEILYFPTGAAFADVATSASYRTLLEQLKSASIADFASGVADTSSPEIPTAGMLVVWLGESLDVNSLSKLREYADNTLTAGSREIWSGALSHLSGLGEQWDLVYVVHFADTRQFQSWVSDPQLQADATVLGRYLRSQSLLTYELSMPK